MRTAVLRLSLALLAVTAVATACGTDTTVRGRGAGGGGGGGGGSVTDTGTSDTGGSDTGSSDGGSDTGPVDCHDLFQSAGGDACLQCTRTSCSAEATAAFGPNFPTQVSGVCASFYDCFMACPCDTANPGEFESSCAIACATSIPAACQTATQALGDCQDANCADACNGGSPTCGNGVLDDGEQCDGAAPSCTSLGFTGGTAFCNQDCTLSTIGCTGSSGSCGNGVIDAGEACDGTNLQGSTCTTYGFTGGTLRCATNCQLDFTACTETSVVCGDGVVAGGEECDGTNLNGESCTSLGYDSGTLRCATCAFDTSRCVSTGPVCGNGLIESGEVCDGANVNGLSCISFGLSGGTLGCASDCLDYDYTGCAADPVCGDGILNGFEQCDGFDFGPDTCASAGYVSGTLTCLSDCTIDYSGCSSSAANLCDPLSATTLRNNTTVSGSFTGAEPTDGPRAGSYYKVYAMSLTAGRTVSITMTSTGTTTLDTYLYLYDGFTCGELASDDDGASTANDSLLTYTITSTGTYYVIATTYNSATTGSYSLTTSTL